MKVDFLHNFRISFGINKHNLKLLTFYLEERSFGWRDAVYKEGDNADGFFLIKEGEFEVRFWNESKLL
jgi:CRP-like cAMP-binding protein